MNAFPNFIVIQAEDAGRALGCYGDPDARTPHLDALAAQSCRFDQMISTAPVCAPSRGCLVSGRYPWSLRLYPAPTLTPVETVWMRISTVC